MLHQKLEVLCYLLAASKFKVKASLTSPEAPPAKSCAVVVLFI